ncbi:MAG: rhodanese-like domain-containing protein [bacterium]
MNVLDYFKSCLEATVSLMAVKNMLTENQEAVCIIDVRNGPPQLLKTKIKGAIVVPQMFIEQRLDQLPKDKILILYCRETWCSLAVSCQSCRTVIRTWF